MDDLSSPIEAALIRYDRVQQALLEQPLRLVVPLLGAALLATAVWLTLLLAGPEALRAAGVSTAWRGWHSCIVPVAALLGLALLLRQPWAVLLLYPAVALLQVLPYVVFRGAVGGVLPGADAATLWVLLGEALMLTVVGWYAFRAR